MLPARLARWEKNTDLVGRRDAAKLAKLPEGERVDCARLRADVDALLARAKGGPGGGPVAAAAPGPGARP